MRSASAPDAMNPDGCPCVRAPSSQPRSNTSPGIQPMGAARMTAPHQEEIGLGQLASGRRENSFVTPAGVHLNGNYVTLFRRVLPARARLRTRGVADAITVVVDGEMVAFLMPLAAP